MCVTARSSQERAPAVKPGEVGDAVTQGLQRRHRSVTPSGDTRVVPNPSTEVKDAVPSRRWASAAAKAESSQRTSRILVIEDDPDVAELIRYTLSKEGYEVSISVKGIQGFEQAKACRPDLILLDIMVPELNGWEVCRRLKQDAELRGIPVIIVTGRAEEGDKVLGFEMGADDYVTKPFSPRELVARVRAVMRRGKILESAGKKLHLKAGELEVDRQRFEVTMKGQRVELTPKEFEVLAVLMGTPGRVFGREDLLDLVWGADAFVEPRTVDVHLARLRAKFIAAGVPAPDLETVRGVGYRFREPA